ncbi:MAG: N-acetylmuramoyl-L-alanine amidase [Eubacteriales bacterium]
MNTDNNGNHEDRFGTLKLLLVVAAIIALIFIIYSATVGILGSTNKIYTQNTQYTKTEPGATTATHYTSDDPLTTTGKSEPTSASENIHTTIQTETTVPQSTSSSGETTFPVTTETTTTSIVTSATTSTTATTDAPKATIFIDPGHGGSDPGTHGELEGNIYYEKEINLSVSLLLANELKNAGFNVVMSRSSDKSTELNSRVPMAEEAGADMFISIHCNSYTGNSRAYGPIVIYTNRDVNYNARAFASLFSSKLDSIKASYPQMRASRIRGDYELNQYYLAVLCSENIPSVLIELGFMTDSSDLKMLLDPVWQEDAAKAIAAAVSAYSFS